MEPLIEDSLSRVLREAPRRDAELRTACEEALSEAASRESMRWRFNQGAGLTRRSGGAAGLPGRRPCVMHSSTPAGAAVSAACERASRPRGASRNERARGRWHSRQASWSPPPERHERRACAAPHLRVVVVPSVFTWCCSSQRRSTSGGPRAFGEPATGAACELLQPACKARKRRARSPRADSKYRCCGYPAQPPHGPALCNDRPAPRSDDDDADRYFRPFQLAAQHSSAKIRTMALDAMQKLIGEDRPVLGWRGGRRSGTVVRSPRQLYCHRARRLPASHIHADPRRDAPTRSMGIPQGLVSPGRGGRQAPAHRRSDRRHRRQQILPVRRRAAAGHQGAAHRGVVQHLPRAGGHAADRRGLHLSDFPRGEAAPSDASNPGPRSQRRP